MTKNNKENKRGEYEAKFEEVYGMLNEKQREAVDTIEGPVVVVAGPGTGKTQILTLRIANILRKAGAGIEPENILALTFTNSGVFAMRERLAEFVGVEQAYDVNIFTFHAFADNQIKRNPEIFSQFLFARPITEIERIQIMEEILEQGDYQKLKSFAGYFEFYAPSILGAINDLKSEAISPKKFEKSLADIEKRILTEEGENAYLKKKSGDRQKGDLKKAIEDKIKNQQEKQKELAEIYKTYQDILQERKLYDFSDMVLAVVEEAEKNEEYLSLLQEKYQYILVDEHQDTNDAQNKMIELIAESPVNEGRPNVFTVGDEKQAIYAFQGASLDNFLRFQKKYRGVKVINLENNYRSSQCILDSAHSVLAGEVALQAGNKEVANLNHKVRVAELGDYKEELIWLAEDIQEQIKNGVKSQDIAVIYRQNKNLPEIKNIFDKYGLAYQVFSKENILDSKELRKLILFLRALNNPYNDEDLAKLLFVDFLGLDTFDVLKVLKLFAYRRGKIRNKSILKIISSLELLQKIEVGQSIEFMGLANKIKEFKKQAEDKDFLEFLEWFISESGFLKHILSSDNSAITLRRLEKIFDEAKKQTLGQKNYTLQDFLDYLEILEKYNIPLDLAQDVSEGGIRLMTAHGSKGLEFKQVYITNFVEGMWPSRKKGSAFKLPINKIVGDVDDEKRLFYVALTRGKCQVTLTYSKFDLEGREKKPSRFLEEIGEEYKEVAKVKKDNLESKVKKYFQPKQEQALSIFDPEHIKEQFLKNHLSVSALNNYMQSPLKYFFRNLLRLPSIQGKSMIFGNIIHQSLEDFFAEVKKEKKILPEKKMLDYFQRALDSTMVLEKYYDEFAKRGKELLKNYYQKYNQEFFVDIETEKKVSSSMTLRDGSLLRLYGIVDKVENIGQNKIRVVDYKTGKTYSEKDKEDKEGLYRQLVFYKFLLEKYYAGLGRPEIKVEECVLDFVEPNKKTGEYEKKVLSISSAEVKELEEEILDFADDILSGKFLQEKYECNRHTKDFFDLWELRG